MTSKQTLKPPADILITFGFDEWKSSTKRRKKSTSLNFSFAPFGTSRRMAWTHHCGTVFHSRRWRNKPNFLAVRCFQSFHQFWLQKIWSTLRQTCKNIGKWVNWVNNDAVMAPALPKPRRFGESSAGWQSFGLPATHQPANTSTEAQHSLSVTFSRCWISVFRSETHWKTIKSKETKERRRTKKSKIWWSGMAS